MPRPRPEPRPRAALRRLRHRCLTPDHVQHVSSRTVGGRFAFHTFDPRFVDLAWGIVATATERYATEVIAFVLLSNHFHALVRGRTAVAISRWTQYVKAGLARLTHAWHGTSGAVWSARYRCTTLLDDDAEAWWLRYVLSHGPKDGLVADPRAWPGLHTARAPADGGPIIGQRLRTKAWLRARGADPAAAMEPFMRPVELRLAPLTGQRPEARCADQAALVASIIAEHADRRLPATYDPSRYTPRHTPDTLKTSPCPRFDARGPNARELLAGAYAALEVGTLHAQQQADALLRPHPTPHATALYDGFQWHPTVLAELLRPGEDPARSTPPRLRAGSLMPARRQACA
ncbi:MAG: transposase [Myxococcales bacterium]|nr:transposase [Myxococcales bacterium]